MGGEIAGFWSYVHADDAGDGGRILSLERKLRDEYRLQTGDEISLFVDHETLGWGDEWAQRINEAIAGTTFFIPILTPSYFHSQECRNELLKFVREAERLGLKQLLMPVYWVTVPELENDPARSADEAIKVVSQYQREDLRDVRLEDEDSAAFRKAVARLAGEIARRVSTVTTAFEDAPGSATLHAVTAASDDDDDDEPGLLDVIAAGEDAMPVFNDILERVAGEIDRVGEIVNVAAQRMEAANSRNEGTKSRLVLAELLARSLDEPAGNIEQLGHRYVATLVTLDPAFHALLDMAGTTLEQTDVTTAFLKTVQSVAFAADQAQRQLAVLLQTLRENAKFSRSLRVPLKRMQTGLQGILDGKALIEEWGRRAAEIDAKQAPDAE
jgi:hypothetical protein